MDSTPQIDERLGISIHDRAKAKYLLYNGATPAAVCAETGLSREIVDRIVSLNHVSDEDKVLVERMRSKLHEAIDNLTTSKWRESTAQQISVCMKLLAENIRLHEGKSTENIVVSGFLAVAGRAQAQIEEELKRMKRVDVEVKAVVAVHGPQQMEKIDAPEIGSSDTPVA